MFLKGHDSTSITLLVPRHGAPYHVVPMPGHDHMVDQMHLV